MTRRQMNANVALYLLYVNINGILFYICTTETQLLLLVYKNTIHLHHLEPSWESMLSEFTGILPIMHPSFCVSNYRFSSKNTILKVARRATINLLQLFKTTSLSLDIALFDDVKSPNVPYTDDTFIELQFPTSL